MVKTFFKSQKLICIALFAVVFVLYINTLQNGFVHDDIWQVELNETVKNIGNISKVFGGCIAEEMLGGCRNIGFYYRPTQALVYLLISQFSTQPWIFHLANVALGAVAGILIYRLLLMLINNRVWAFAGGLIFVVHPANSEVFNWISALPEILSAIFILLTLIFYRQFLEKKKPVWLVYSALSFFSALLTKETAMFYLPLLPLMTILAGKGKIKFPRFYHLGWFLIPVLGYLGIRSMVLGRVIYEYEGYYALNTAAQIFTGLSLFPKYLMELIFPWPLSFQPVVNPVFEYENTVLIGFITLAAMAGAVYSSIRKRVTLLVLGLSIIISGILPALIFVNKLGENLYSERYVFIPSIGFSMVIIALFQQGLLKYKFLDKKLLIGLLAVFIVVSFLTVFPRAGDWKDNFSSYQSMVRIDPMHKKAHLMLGKIYQEKGDAQSALREFETALKIDPRYAEAQNEIDLMTRRFDSKTGLIFYYPDRWEIKDGEEKIVLTEKVSGFNLEMSLSNLEKDQTAEQFIQKAVLEEGELKNQGPAKIPNFETAFVKVYELNSKPKLYFFLVKGEKVIEAVVYPADSELMREFDKIISSINISKP